MFTHSAIAIALGGRLLIRIEASEPRQLNALVDLFGTHMSRLFARDSETRDFETRDPFPDPIAL